MVKKARHEIDRNGPRDPFGLHLDLFLYVSTFLRFNDVCSMMAVSKEAIYKCTRALRSWANVCVTDETVDSVSKYCRNIKCMEIPMFYEKRMLKHYLNITNDNRRIQTMRVLNISYKLMEVLSPTSLPRLLKLEASLIPDLALEWFGQKLESLTFYDSRDWIMDPQVAGKRCPELVSLDLSDITAPRGNLLKSFATNCLKLRRLTTGCTQEIMPQLSLFTNLTYLSLCSIGYIDMTICAPCLTNLTQLKLSCLGVIGLELTARSCPKLTTLYLTTRDPSHLYGFLTCCPKLEDLRLSLPPRSIITNCFERLLQDEKVLENLTSLFISGHFEIPRHYKLSQVTPHLKRFLLCRHEQCVHQIPRTLDPGLTQLRELDLSFSEDFVANSDNVVRYISSHDTFPALNQLGIPRRFVDVARRFNRGCFVREIPHIYETFFDV